MDLPIKDINIIKLIKEEYRKNKNYRDLLFFLLAINTGLKITDILNFNVGDVRNKNYIIVEHGRTDVKTIKRIYLNQEIQELIKLVIGKKANDVPLFVSQRGHRLQLRGILYSFKTLRDGLGLNKAYTVASLRKTFGYHYYQKTKDLTYLQWLFNQTTIDQTMHYIDIDEDLNFRYDSEFSL